MTSPHPTALAFCCARCGECCRTLRVPITDTDLARLNAGTGLPGADLVRWCAPEEIDMEGEPETFVSLRQGRRLMVLTQRDGACYFLRDARCTAHPYRPTACAAFPFALLPDGRGERLAAPCEPATLPPSADLVAVGSALKVELERYVGRVQEWNRRQRHRLRLHRPPKTSDDFLRYLARSSPRDEAPPPGGGA